MNLATSRRLPALTGITLVLASLSSLRADELTNRVAYRLPYDGKEKTYRVTLAAAPKDKPDWIVSTFVSGAVRTVNASNKGAFTETWNGLDDNYMPVPPGEYVFKGIFTPAEKWKIDGQFHSLIAEFITSPGDSWTGTAENDLRFPTIHGHVFEPIYQVAVSDEGKAAFLSGYVENWYNPILADLNKDVGWDQVLMRYASSGRAGGQLVAFDGQRIWMTRGNEVYCASHGGFGETKSRRGHGITILESNGKIAPSDLTVITTGTKRYLYVAEPGRQRISILDGVTGKKLGPMEKLEVLATVGDRVEKDKRLFALLKSLNGRHRVVAFDLKDGLPDGASKPLFDLDDSVKAPHDLETDRQGNFYILDGRQVRKYDAKGKLLLTIGKEGKQQGDYDPLVMVRPNKLACWKDREGKERLLITEIGGAMRISEWSCLEGKLLREWHLCQNAAAGFCIDPEQPDHLYVTSLISTELVRYRVDYEKKTWKVDCVWEDMCRNEDSFPTGRMVPEIHNRKGRKYLTFGGGSYRSRGQWMVYRQDGNRWVPSAACFKNQWWHDANGDGNYDEKEVTESNAKKPNATYWGAKVLPDLSTIVPIQNGNSWYRLKPRGFDTHGNPIYHAADWKELFRDPFIEGLARGKKLPPLHGGNEIGINLWNWSDAAGSDENGFFLAAVSHPENPGGPDEAGSGFAQWKLMYLEPRDGGLLMKWRVGRKSFGVAQPGQVYATMHLGQPAHGLIGMADGNGVYHVFTTDGLFVDTLMHDRFRFGMERGGMYTHSGGCYYGKHFAAKDGKVYLCMGRASNNLYAVKNWKEGFVQRLEIETRSATLTADQIAKPDARALQLRKELKKKKPHINVRTE